MSELKIIYKSLDELTPYEDNPRHNEQAIDGVANSIDNFGFKVPIVIDKDDVIVCGHTRYLASQQLGLDKVPCVVADDLTEEQIKAYRLVDNKVAELSEWDFSLLDKELAELENIDMSQFGFDELIDELGYEEKFSLPDEKSNYSQITFQLSQEQLSHIKKIIENTKKDYKEVLSEYEEDNPNTNGNILYLVMTEWDEQRKLI